MTSGLFNLLRRAGAQLNVSPTKKQGEPANIATITVAIDFYLYPLDKRHKVHYYMPPLTGFVCIGISELRKSWALQHLFVYLLILLLILFACRFFFMINDAALVFFHSNFVVSVNFCLWTNPPARSIAILRCCACKIRSYVIFLGIKYLSSIVANLTLI